MRGHGMSTGGNGVRAGGHDLLSYGYFNLCGFGRLMCGKPMAFRFGVYFIPVRRSLTKNQIGSLTERRSLSAHQSGRAAFSVQRSLFISAEQQFYVERNSFYKEQQPPQVLR